MIKATEELLKDHKLIRQTMSQWKIDNPRFEQLHKTLQRVTLGHAWFEDKVFFPAMGFQPAFDKRFLDELYQEHKDIEFMLESVRKTPTEDREKLEFGVIQLRTLLLAHFEKEEDALFPICERILDAVAQNKLAEDMRARQHEMRKSLENL